MTEEPLYVSEDGEFGTWPHDSETVIEPVSPRFEPRWQDLADPENAHLQIREKRWHRCRFSPAAEQAVRRLMAERDEAREQVVFLMAFVEEIAVGRLAGPAISVEGGKRWQQWHELWRRLREEPWFRDRRRS